MASGPFEQHSPSGWRQPAAGTAVGEYWLDSGPALPLRTWQRKTRFWVILISSIGGAILVAIAIGALVLGLVFSHFFTASGGVAVDCASGTAAAPGGVVAERTPMIIFDDRGERVGSTTLGAMIRADDGCRLPFEVRNLRSGNGPYTLRVGDVFAQTVSEGALSAGVTLRPI
ncbi:hypothetical protein [Gordonia bronchialis]|uniref:hypothetical protein n=1 Tax=Gordonia bronchialis TaxID=2054 RepID=UPI00242B4AC5|nr:hypothetical protein [Gordonia bronchialis]